MFVSACRAMIAGAMTIAVFAAPSGAQATKTQRAAQTAARTASGVLAPADIQRALNAAYDKYKTLQEGKNADYIPALAKVDPNLFGIALVTPDGQIFTAGDTTTEVSIQSISKVFTLALVMEQQGVAAVEKTIGVDATGQAFNSIVARSCTFTATEHCLV